MRYNAATHHSVGVVRGDTCSGPALLLPLQLLPEAKEIPGAPVTLQRAIQRNGTHIVAHVVRAVFTQRGNCTRH
jgi:hypothetical protein